MPNITITDTTGATTNPGPFQGLINFLGSPIGIVLIIAIIIIVFIILYMKATKKKKEFENVVFSKMVDDNLKAKFSIKSIKVKAALVQGFIELGKINRIIHEKGYQDILYHDDKKDKFVKPPRNKTKEYPIHKKYDVYIFRINPTGFILIRFIRFLIGKQLFRYVFVENRHLENYNGPKDRMYNIKEDLAVQVFGKVFITSDMTHDYLSDIAIKYAHEALLTFVGNYAPKVIYIEAEHTKGMNRYRTKKEIDTKAFKDYKKASDDVKDDDDND